MACSKLLLLVYQVVNCCAVVQLLIFYTLYHVVVVISVLLLQRLGLLSVNDDLGSVQRVQVRSCVAVDLADGLTRVGTAALAVHRALVLDLHVETHEAVVDRFLLA